MSRFERQKKLPGFGSEGQKKLSESRILVIGAGGLGCPALLYLAAAGVGTLGIADGDSIGESNLNRQTLFGQNDIGKSKAETAANVLKEKYPEIDFNIIPHFLKAENALDVLKSYDLVLDGSDNFGTRYMLNDACLLLKIPLIMGAIYQYEGQLMVFNFEENPMNYRDIYPIPPKSDEIPNCSETGVLGVLPGIIGNLQAAEAIKIRTGIGEVLKNKVLFYNLKTCAFYDVAIEPNPDSQKDIPISEEEFKQRDYQISCGLAEIISWEKALDWSENIGNSKLIDIRELDEEPIVENRAFEKIPMKKLMENPEQIMDVENIFLFCKSGQRSELLAEKLKELFPEKKICSIRGGILDKLSPFKNKGK
ncbi:MAG TPA: HesA/MoeB/ThiF family protein [Flavobacteriaceae bacterium]|nr:HesA/MoeB/ThiF family protein [Flavobacteriaceae bacterium]